jgi:uncharacterized YccA/Bax inhibitor family protein
MAAGMLLLHKYNSMSVTEKFRTIVIIAMFGIAAVYIVGWIMSLFGGNMPFIHSSGAFGLVFSAFVVVMAALNLTLDFDCIGKVSNRGLSSHMGWFSALGWRVILIWLYLEILRMLVKTRRRWDFLFNC